MMRVLDLSFPAPTENLAFDEVLLRGVADGSAPPTMRFWESPMPFVVLGTSQRLAREVHEARCRADSVPILRRCPAGGCVLQGPGSLNYTLALPLGQWPELQGLHESYRFILGRIASALARQGVPATHEGICDLAIDGRKVSGNAQRRVKGAVLHHGTLLYRPDYSGMGRYLCEPEDRPEYRGGRTHGQFVAALPLSASQLHDVVRLAFDAMGAPGQAGETELADTRALALEKYSTREWTHRR